MNEILVDTSVWVELYRGRLTPAVRTMEELLRQERVCTNGLIRAEILSGAGSPSDYASLEEELSAVTLLVDPPDLWATVARARFQLFRKGFQVSIADLIIAASAHHYQRRLFTLDTAFQEIKTVLPVVLMPPAS